MRKGLGLILLVLIVAYFVNRPGTPTVPTLPPLSATEALDQGRRLFDDWGNPKLRSNVQLSAVDRVILNLERVPDSDQLHSTARKAAEVLRPIQQALAKQAEERAQKEKDQKAAEEAQWVRNVVAVRQLRSSMHNPSSFDLDEALRMSDGTLCLTYRAKNAFNAIRVGRAVIDEKRLLRRMIQIAFPVCGIVFAQTRWGPASNIFDWLCNKSDQRHCLAMAVLDSSAVLFIESADGRASQMARGELFEAAPCPSIPLNSRS